ncbi:DNA glycosylase [Hypoxylon sp. FL1284]|nr:DNA glycosylase [Hypoxylon sp. FL1284]
MPPRPVASPPRRITRSSLARFRYGDASGSSSKENSVSSPAADIEDIIPSATTTRKRKRTTVLESPSATSPPRRAIKTEEIETKVTPPSASRRQRKPARKTVDEATGEATVSAPSDWEEMYEVVKAMRAPGGAAANAAVDTMGCERLAEATASPRDQRFQTLVALMLSSQTKDTTNAVAMRRLQTELPAHAAGARPGLTLENILAVDPAVLNKLIWAVGFHNNKTRYLQQAAAILRDSWAGDVPDTYEGLVALPGVGPKMAHLCLSAAWGRTEGIGVDVHVHRITNLWGWHATRAPEATRAALQAWLPRDRWREINALLVGLGQTVCLPVARRCGDCDLGLRGLCRAAERAKVREGRRVREATAQVEKDDGGSDEAVIKVEELREDEEVVVKDVVVNEGVEGVKTEPETSDSLEEEPEPGPGQRKTLRRERHRPKKM